MENTQSQKHTMVHNRNNWIARITLNDEKETVKAQGPVPRKFIPG